MMRRVCSTLAAGLALAFTPTATASADGTESAALSAVEGKLVVQLSGFKSDKGAAMISLHNQEKTFPMKPGLRAVRRRIVEASAHYEFTGLAEGTYAVSVYHDENDNGELDTNFLGIPKEAVGTSNNAKGRMGPPKWKDARFLVKGAVVQKIVMQKI